MRDNIMAPSGSQHQNQSFLANNSRFDPQIARARLMSRFRSKLILSSFLSLAVSLCQTPHATSCLSLIVDWFENTQTLRQILKHNHTLVELLFFVINHRFQSLRTSFRPLKLVQQVRVSELEGSFVFDLLLEHLLFDIVVDST